MSLLNSLFLILASSIGIYIIYIALLLVCSVFVYFAIKLMNDQKFRLDMLGEKGDSEISISDKLKGRGKMLFLYPLMMLAFFGGMFWLLLSMDQVDKQYYAFDSHGKGTTIKTQFATFLKGTLTEKLSWDMEIDSGNNINVHGRKIGHINAISENLFLTNKGGHHTDRVAFSKESGKRSDIIIKGALAGDMNSLEVVALDTSSLNWTLHTKDYMVYTKEGIQLGKLTKDSQFPYNADVKWHKISFDLTNSLNRKSPSSGDIGVYNSFKWKIEIENVASGPIVKILKEKSENGKISIEIDKVSPLGLKDQENFEYKFTASDGTKERHYYVINYSLDLNKSSKNGRRFASFLIMEW